MNGERSSQRSVSVEQILALHARVAGDIIEVDAQTWAIHGFIPVDGEVILAEFDHPQTARLLLDQLVENETGTNAEQALPVPATSVSAAGRRPTAMVQPGPAMPVPPRPGIRAVAGMRPRADGTGQFDRRFAEPPDALLTTLEDRALALLDTTVAADAAVEELIAMGVLRDDIVVLRGPKGAERLDASGEWNGLWGRIYRLLEWMGDERDLLLRIGEHLAAGGLVVTVPVEDGSEAAVTMALASHGGHDMVRFGRRYWERLGRD